MKNWDDRRYFLALARAGTIVLAAKMLGVNRSTVLRRITALEDNVGVVLFQRLPTGYILTPAGEEMREAVSDLEDRITSIDRRLSGKDTDLSGNIRVSIAGALARQVLMPELAKFTKEHPDIKLEILSTFHMTNLARRDADIAIRISDSPPENLIGRRILRVAKMAYVARDAAMANEENLIGWSLAAANQGQMTVVSDPYATIAAIEAGVGYSVLPCFMGDLESGLRRVNDNDVTFTDLWVLTHPDMQNTARIRVFREMIIVALQKYRPLLEGKRPAK